MTDQQNMGLRELNSEFERQNTKEQPQPHLPLLLSPTTNPPQKIDYRSAKMRAYWFDNAEVGALNPLEEED
jgi:hypothetical protein